mgnify:CR=1
EMTGHDMIGGSSRKLIFFLLFSYPGFLFSEDLPVPVLPTLLEVCCIIDGPSYPIVDPYGDHALNCASGNAQRTQHWHDPVRDDFVMFGKMVGLPTRSEPAGMFPWSDER